MKTRSGFSPPLLLLLEAFEAEVAARPGWGLRAWFEHLRDVRPAEALVRPTSLFRKGIIAPGAAPDAARWLEAASRPESYADSIRGRALALLHAATARAVGDLSATMGRNALFEVAHNTGFFAHLASTLWTYQALDREPGEAGAEPPVFWADMASERVEATAGGDFAIIAPLDRTTCKLAVVQAKSELPGRIRRADLRHLVGQDQRPQFDILLEHEDENPVAGVAERGTIFGSWCFYVFWHRPRGPGDVLPPVVRSAWNIAHVAHERRRRQQNAGAWTPSEVPTTVDGVDLATFMTLHLPDARSGVGLVCRPEDVPGLLGIEMARPRTVVLLNLPGCDWPLGYWPELLKNLKGYEDLTRLPPPRRASAANAARTVRTQGPTTKR